MTQLASPTHPRLSLRSKFVYGLGDWGTSAATTARNLFWLFFLVSVVGIASNVAGTVILVGKVWDAVNDPLIGMISDKVKTRWGRRRPFLLFGAFPIGLVFFFLFFVPPIPNQMGLAIYYGIVILLFDTLFTVVNVPYAALTPELTEDYDERSSLAGWRMATSILAALVTGASFKLLAENVFGPWLAGLGLVSGRGSHLQAGYSLTAALWSVMLILPPLILFKAIREPERAADPDPIRPWQNFKEVFSNRPFRLAATVYLLSFATVDLIVAVFLWFLVYYMRVRPGFDSVILAVVLGLAFLSMPLVVKLMHRFGKRNTYIGAMLVFAVVMYILAQVPPGGERQLLVAAVFASLGYGAANAIPWAIVADVIEEDELKTGKRREGLYTGYLVLFRKLGGAMAVFVVGHVLAARGFISSTAGSTVFIQQPTAALDALRFFVGVAPALMLFLSILAAWHYPLDRRAHDEIRQQLAERRATQAEG